MKSKLNKLLPILFLISFAIALYCNTGLFGVTGNSMNPTIKDGDLLFVSKTKHIKYNDILIIDYDKLKTDIVKRVVGLPGDTIKIDKTGFYRNGVKVETIQSYMGILQKSSMYYYIVDYEGPRKRIWNRKKADRIPI